MENNGRKILVVDDDELLCEFYTRILTFKGYNVVCAANGDEALQQLRKSSDFDLAIIDLLMPILSGAELIEIIKKTPELARIPLLVITGLAKTSEELETVRATCDEIMFKGKFELPRFLQTVERLCSGNPGT